MAFVRDVVRTSREFVVIGTQYEQPLPNLGPPPPHEGRVWASTDGRTWTDVTPDSTFRNVDLRHLAVTADGSLIVFGLQSRLMDGGILQVSEVSAWESSDGRAWRSVATGLPAGSRVLDFDQGDRGSVAWISRDVTASPTELWFSADERSWQHVYDLPAGSMSVGAGDEGFVVTGVRGSFPDSQTLAIASSDGREWFDASSPPAVGARVAPRGADWVAIASDRPADFGSSGEASVWSSANGLNWEQIGVMPLPVVSLEGGGTCREFNPSVVTAGPWLIAATTLAGPCGEGGFFVNGTARISVDGATWIPLPFAQGTPGVSGSGSGVSAAAAVDGGLLLAGESNRMATFWIGEAP
ncbi:MAG: hypothetical protein M3R49_05685 [Chloroflexota bacterium]|nr:hypothetical protein [Chloroflexota bacterium]